MTPSNVYMIEVLATVNTLSIIALGLMPLACGFLFLAMSDYHTGDKEKITLKKIMVLCVLIFVIALLTVIFVPSKETLMLIYGGK
ncbi:TPA: hypothetical protein R4323_002445 [Pasteurella multocida]|nr:hypothetical protein [Pasteurella multocida]